MKEVHMKGWKLGFVFLVFLLAVQVFGQGCPPPTNIPVGTCTPQSGTIQNFAGDTGPMRVRKSIFKLTASEVADLKLAFQKLRALPASDPRTWMAQANVHCWYCGGGTTTVPDVHSNWAFLPWHRDYLYNLEKTLGSLIGKPDFALPYWDWNTADTTNCTGHLKVPPPYLGGPVTSNSLFNCYRKISASSTMDVNRVGPARINNLLTNNNTFDLFFGTATSSSAMSPGPHGYVHLWIGNPATLSGTQDMGILDTAARDPLFWAHHANIDRIWEMWIARYGAPTYPTNFKNQNWVFWNQNKVRTRYTGDDAANRATRLKYRYDPPCGSLSVTTIPDLVTLTPTPMTVHAQADVPSDREFNIKGVTGRHVVLHLEDVSVPADEAAILRVYINKPSATASESVNDVAGAGNLVEELFIVPSRSPGAEHHEGHEHKMHIRIPLPPDIAAEVERAKGEVDVTIVPVTAGDEGVLMAAPQAVHVTLKKPYISVE
jgi:polyphenol oxidase